jgi:hypothetical protein
MPRTTTNAVKKIIEVDDKLVTDLDAFTETAASLVDRCEAADPSVSAATWELVERWLAAHFYAILDPRYTEEEADTVSAKYQQKTGMFFKGTMYGQQAMMLDPSGCLAAISAKAEKGEPRNIQVLNIPREACNG